MEIDHLYMAEAQAKRFGYEEHAGPFNLDVMEQRFMLESCLRDFALRPGRKAVLVKKRRVTGINGRTKEMTFVWASHVRRMLGRGRRARARRTLAK